ncbi:hypothetical protein AVEN_167971-1 [Araneus ventricosus]|uniref:Uncharacterized protein n=1 Tax=Araneus ventricosus TaxID=182803 RepID=A0A4Y2SRW1_ARAVE|nr:hypothetical protein AVEN_167971-1 [Araneus ventricosus]
MKNPKKVISQPSIHLKSAIQLVSLRKNGRETLSSLSPTCSHGKNTTRRHFTRGNGNAFSPLFFDDAHVSGTGSRKFMGSLLAQQQVPATGLLESPPLTQKQEATSTSSAADPPTLLALGFSHESSGNRLFKRERTLNGAWCSPWLHAFERCEWCGVAGLDER